MGQEIYINFDAENLKSARVRSANDLRNQKFTQLVSGDSLQFDLFLVGSSGLLNIQDYAEVRLGVGELDARPESGTYQIDTATPLAYNHTAAELEAIIDAEVAPATTSQLTPFVFKIQFTNYGSQTIPSIDARLLQPSSTVSVTRLVTGDADTKETWLWRIYRNPVAFTNTFEDISGQGIRGTISLATAGVYDLLADKEEVNTNLEVELTDDDGLVRTVLQAELKLRGEVIGHNFTGSVPVSPSIPPSASDFLESFPTPVLPDGLYIGDDANRQILDDFQQGSFSPILSVKKDNVTYEQSNYDIQQGYYVKTGQSVSVSMLLKITSPDDEIKNAPQDAEMCIKNMPFNSLIDGSDDSQMVIDIYPRQGWQNFGGSSQAGKIDDNRKMFFQQQLSDSSATPGDGVNLDVISPEDFDANPLNFTSGGNRAFTFSASGTYITNNGGLVNSYGKPVAAYSLRDITNNGGVVVRIRRDSDNTYDNFTAAEIESGEMLSWVTETNSSASGFVQTFFDQSGNDRNLNATLSTYEPKIVENGEYLGELKFDGIDDHLVDETVLFDNDDLLSAFIVSKLDPVSTTRQTMMSYFYSVEADASATNGFTIEQNAVGLGFFGGVFDADYWTGGTPAYDENYLVGSNLTSNSYALHNLELTGSNLALYQNDSTVQTRTGAGMSSTRKATWQRLKIGGSESLSQPMSGSIKEIIIYNSDQSANRESIRDNINNYYNIYS